MPGTLYIIDPRAVPKPSALSCDQVRAILSRIPLDMPFESMGRVRRKAFAHYAICQSCRNVGMGAIVKTRLECLEAIRVCARRPGEAFGFGDCFRLPTTKSMKEHLASEHVWGIIPIEPDGRVKLGIGMIGPHDQHCAEVACREYAQYWRNAFANRYVNRQPYSGAEQEPRFLVRLAERHGWPLDSFSTH